jgi:site-specific recombinase XerD
MSLAGIAGSQVSPKALRHGFAVGALNAKVPVTLVQKWLGHSRLSTTAIYVNAVGDEERAIANRYWSIT